jgi:hypothetical protein
MKAIRLIFVVLVVLGLGGCFFFNGDTTTATLEVVNNSSNIIYYVHIRPVLSGPWSSDLLGAGNSILSGDRFIFTGITPGTYYLDARDLGDSVVLKTTWPYFGIDFAAGEKVVWIVD